MVLQAPTACLPAYENAVWIPAFAGMMGDGENSLKQFLFFCSGLKDLLVFKAIC